MTGNGLEHQIGSIPQIKDKLHNNSFQAQFTQLQLQETVFGMRTASRMRTVEGWTSEAVLDAAGQKDTVLMPY